MGEVEAEHVPPDDTFDVVVIAASLGGLEAVRVILAGLPEDFRAGIALVLHRAPQGPSPLAAILNGRTRLAVKDAEESDRLRPGVVHLAPPNRHLLINPDGSLSLSDSAKVHFSRPAADRLFESGAASFGGRIIAVVLTGGNDDGAVGVRAVKRMGGRVIAQDQATSEAFRMPHAAIETGCVDLILPLREIAPTLVSMVRG
jgi:two-component system chemotaxis response regulator CheB